MNARPCQVFLAELLLRVMAERRRWIRLMSQRLSFQRLHFRDPILSKHGGTWQNTPKRVKTDIWLRPQRQARRRVVAGTCWAAASQAQSPGPSPSPSPTAPAPAPAQKCKSMESWILEASDERCSDRLALFVSEFCSLWSPSAKPFVTERIVIASCS